MPKKKPTPTPSISTILMLFEGIEFDIIGEHEFAGQPDEMLTVDQRISRAKWEGELLGLSHAVSMLRDILSGAVTL